MRTKSHKPRMQRRWQLKIKPHQRSKIFTVKLSDDLAQEWGIKRLPVRVDDEVRVIKGSMKGLEGKVLKKRKDGKLEIESCTIEKKNGTTYFVPISPNNVILLKLGGKKMDPMREKIINRMQKLQTIDEIRAPKKETGESS